MTFSPRRTAARAGILGAAVLLLGFLAGCGTGYRWHALDVSGSSPSLAFTMSRTPDGKRVTAANFRGHIVLLYFGYTHCPDVCPTTLANVVGLLDRLGPDAKPVRLLFVTVDPDRDTLPVITRYVAMFSPQIVGLRGTTDQIARLARRFRVAYSVAKASSGHAYEVSHSSSIYVFDRTGAARLLLPKLDMAKPDLSGIAADLERLLGSRSANPLQTLVHLL
ncbi:MAG: SCO family protein [Cyanobacteria bacterium REEB65]|nr:SCO family protein [Cyanobacteria bacterium REEB65]